LEFYSAAADRNGRARRIVPRNTKGTLEASPLSVACLVDGRDYFFFAAFFAAFFAGAFLAAFFVAIFLFSLFDGLHRNCNSELQLRNV
jgi:hypothetical protein